MFYYELLGCPYFPWVVRIPYISGRLSLQTPQDLRYSSISSRSKLCTRTVCVAATVTFLMALSSFCPVSSTTIFRFSVPFSSLLFSCPVYRTSLSILLYHFRHRLLLGNTVNISSIDNLPCIHTNHLPVWKDLANLF